VPRLDEVAINQRAALFAVMVTAATGLVVGLLPARRAAGTISANACGSPHGRAHSVAAIVPHAA
jgi:hypothetical protein